MAQALECVPEGDIPQLFGVTERWHMLRKQVMDFLDADSVVYRSASVINQSMHCWYLHVHGHRATVMAAEGAVVAEAGATAMAAEGAEVAETGARYHADSRGC